MKTIELRSLQIPRIAQQSDPVPRLASLAFKNRLDRPPSTEIPALVKALLADAGDDVKGEIIASLGR